MSREFPLIEVEGTPNSIGLQYGEKCRPLIQRRLQVMKQLFQNGDLFDFKFEKAIECSQKFLPFIQKYNPEFIEEMNALADGAELDKNDILFLNVLYEFFSRKIPGVWDRCTTLFVKPDVTSDGITIIGQNDDWNEMFREFMILLKIRQKSKPDIIQLCDAGTIGGNGINNSGIALCANSIISGGWSFEGVPHLLIKRGILNSQNLADSIAAITSVPRCSSHNFLLAHSDGEGIDIEATPTQCNFIFPEEGFITHSNHFVSQNPHIHDYKVLRSPDTLLRKQRADTILNEEKGRISLSTIKRVFTDHFSKPHSVCRHPNSQTPPINQMQTNASMIVDMTNRELHLSNGPPCINEYNIYEI